MYNPEDTICAIATPPGESALAIVRLSGRLAKAIAGKVFRGQSLEDRKAAHGYIIDNQDRRMDEVIVIGYDGPRSYSGEDLVEIICHGGYVVSGQILALLREHGARPAEPGEFTLRAFLNGRLDLTEAEAVSSVISAKTAKSKDLALYNLEGKLKSRLESISARLIDLTTILEAEIDFGDEEVTKLSADDIIDRINEIALLLDDTIATYDIGRISEGRARIAIVGAPNVGKSSLFNAILKSGRAIVTEIPGTTRDYLSEYVNIDGYPVILTDTAGIRDSDEEIEQIGIGRSREIIDNSDLCIFVLDGTREFYDDDYQIAEYIKGKVAVTAINKIDLVLDYSVGPDKNIAQGKTMHISAKTGDGISGLMAAVRKSLLGRDIGLSDGLILSQRQYNCALEARKALKRGSELIGAGEPEEVYIGEIREALDQIGIITGKVTNDDILNRIFAEFCIGK